MAKIQEWKKGKRFAQHDLIRGIRKPMPPPSRPFYNNDDDDSWKKEAREFQMQDQDQSAQPKQN